MDLKFSARSITILDNFFKINQGMLFRVGKELRTRAPTNEYFAVARISEDIPRDFAIADLSMFVGLLRHHKDSIIQFSEASQRTVYIKGTENNRTFEYTLAEPRMIQSLKSGPVPFPEDKVVSKFTLELSEFKLFQKTIHTAGFSDAEFSSNGETIRFSGFDKNNPSSHRYSADVGKSKAEFKAKFSAQKLGILLDASYNISIAKTDKGFFITRWHSDDVDYYIASDADS